MHRLLRQIQPYHLQVYGLYPLNLVILVPLELTDAQYFSKSDQRPYMLDSTCLEPDGTASHIAYLQAAANPDDYNAIKIILNEPKRGIGKKSIENIEHIAANEAISFKEALAKQKLLQDKPAKAVRKLIKNLNSWETNNIDEPVGFRLRELLIDAGYWKQISRMDKAEDKIKILENLLATLNEFSTIENILKTLTERQELKDAPKPKTASLLEKMSAENITIEDAINVLSLPRELPIQETIIIEIKKTGVKFFI